MPSNTIGEFIIFLVPGFLAHLIYNWFHPRRERSDFVKVAESILAGVFILYFVRLIDWQLLGGWLKSNTTDFPAGRFVAALLLVAILLGGIGAWTIQVRTRIAQKFPWLRMLDPNKYAVWNDIPQHKQHVTVYEPPLAADDPHQPQPRSA